jgi:prolyl 4-hydroxylase
MSNHVMPTVNADAALTLSDCVQVFDDAFSAEFCQQMLHSFHALARFQKNNGKGVGAGLDNSSWTELDVTALTDAGFRASLAANMEKYAHLYNAKLAQNIDVPITRKLDQLVIKRYRPGGLDQFQPHFDALGAVAHRYLVFLWYLNDVQTGGETYFPRLNLSVQPKAGRLLMFPPYWMFQHEGRPPISGDKYIFSTYFLF